MSDGVVLPIACGSHHHSSRITSLQAPLGTAHKACPQTGPEADRSPAPKSLATPPPSGYTHAPVFGASSMKDKPAGTGLLLVGVGSMLTSMIAAGFLLGYGVDNWLDSRPVFMLVFGGLGFVGGFLKVYRLLSRT